MSIERRNQYLDYLINPSFQGVNRLFVLFIENKVGRKADTWHFLPKVEIKNYNGIIYGQKFFDQLLISNNIW